MIPHSADIWIVDDVQSNRSLFAEIVSTLGHTPKTFHTGESAIEAAATETPDMILLDVMMPGIDGFEACKELRKKFDNEMVPIVMITANPDREMYSQGLEAGADDYLFQPIDLAAIRSRISAMLRLRSAYQELNVTKDKLATRVELLRNEVAEAEQLLHLNDRLQSVGMMVAGIAHELRNPLSAVRFNLEWVADQIRREGSADAAWRTQVAESVDISLEATANLDQLVADLSTFARPDREDNQNSVVSVVIDSALRVTRHTVLTHATLELDAADNAIAKIRPRRLAQVIINLVVNAARAIAKTKKRGQIRIRARREGDWVEITIADSGIGLPADAEKMFKPFFTTDPGGGGGTGLGLGICAQIVRNAGGIIASSTSDLGGAEIHVRIPGAWT